MKRKFTFFVLLYSLALYAVHGQMSEPRVCEGDVTLSSQAEVDAFNCTEIIGSLTISGSDIVDLSPLKILTRTGNIYIGENTNLTNIDGLSGIKRVSLYGAPYSISVYGNPMLKNLDGLSNLEMDSLGSVSITRNQSLETINAFSSATMFFGLFSISENPSLKSFNGLGNIKRGESSGFNPYILISNNASLENLDGFASLESLSGSGANLDIRDNAMLKNIDGLSSFKGLSGGGRGTGLFIENNPELKNVDGLKSFNYIGYGIVGGLFIRNNAKLENVDGLFNFKAYTGNFYGIVSNNPSLTRCDGLFPMMLSFGLDNIHPPQWDISGNGSGCTVADIIANGPAAISGFSLVDTRTGNRSGFWNDYGDLYMADSAYPFLVLQADTASQKVKSVEFKVGNVTYLDNEAPFRFDLQLLPPGNYTIVAVPYSLPNKQGEKGISRTVTLNISVGAGLYNLKAVDTAGNLIKYLYGEERINLKDPIYKSFNIVAEGYPERFNNVKFYLNDKLVATEKSLPYAIAGDPGEGSGTYYAWKPKPGKYKLRAVPYILHNKTELAGSAAEVSIEIFEQPTISITSFDLVDTSGKILKQLQNGEKINIAEPAFKNFTIVANTTGKVGSVKLKLDHNSLVENVIPYSATGDINGYFTPWKATVGNHSVSAIPFHTSNGQGDSGHEFKVRFSIVNEPLIFITSFDLVDTKGKILKSLNEGDKINIADPQFKAFTIIANTGGKIGSVKLKLDQTWIVENVTPYTATGDQNGNFNAWNASVGNHAIAAIPYNNAGGQGAAGKELKINFTVVKEFSSANLIVSLYPVPVKDVLSVEIKNGANAKFSLVLRNSQGHAIHNGTYTGSSYTINTASLPQGIYFLQLRGSNGVEKVIRVVK